MTDAAIQSLALVVIALFSMISAIAGPYFAYKSIQSSRKNAEGIKDIAGTVQEIKHQTNSLTSALVLKTEEKAQMSVDAATLAGKEAERLRGEETAATLERGRRAGMEAAVAQAVGPAINPLAPAPVPVTDKAAVRVADATEKLAEAATKAAEKNP